MKAIDFIEYIKKELIQSIVREFVLQENKP